jgi:hypothetical protein
LALCTGTAKYTWQIWRKQMCNSSKLYDQNTFYTAFERDLKHCKQELIIESPFITARRMNALLPFFARLRKRGVSIIVNTRNPAEHNGDYYYQSLDAVTTMQAIGITILYTVGHHRKLAVIDREMFYEGSLNILSYSDSCEIMRRIVSSSETEMLIKFIGIKKNVRCKYGF